MRARQSDTSTQARDEVRFDDILVALDASPHADRALAEALRLVKPDGGTITGIHAYAAAMHDRRFKQMEGGLPERYKVEDEMEYQREVHDSLITRGLEIISDSYHDVAGTACEAAEVPFKRLSPEGKNYACIIEAAEAGDYDVIAMGSLGLGVVPGSLIGTVCERVVRRSSVDSLVIRDHEKAIGDGPIVVGLDGSEQSLGALMTGFTLAQSLGVALHAVAAYDPYYHYVAFNKIAGVLSDEAGKVFRFKEQEALHEELIDDGIAKIYQSHLEVATRLAEERETELTVKLLDGKPFRAISDYLTEVGASLLIIGKTGVHADDGLDIGGNAENLLRLAPCHVWLGTREYRPDAELVAEETITWSDEAEAFLKRAPSFAQTIARKAVIRLAQEQGHTFITKSIVEEVANKLMPRGCPAHRAAETGEAALTWSKAASKLVADIADTSLQSGILLRAEKKARREGAAQIGIEHVRPFMEAGPTAIASGAELTWSAATLARLSRVPEGVRDQVRERIEEIAREQGADEVTVEIAEEGFAEGRRAMHEAMLTGGHTKTATKTVDEE